MTDRNQGLDLPHCCDLIRGYLADADIPLLYYAKFREYGLRMIDDGISYIILIYCPWCGAPFPPSMRDAWFEKIEKLGLEPGNPNIPAHLTTDAWWKTGHHE